MSEPNRIQYGTRDDGSMWLSIGDPAKGPHVQGDWNFGEANARLFVAALRAAEDAAA